MIELGEEAARIKHLIETKQYMRHYLTSAIIWAILVGVASFVYLHGVKLYREREDGGEDE
eukprot:COSAG04_NODE_10724_length_757_cov_0.917933_1_plen_60_part_10